MTAKIRPENTVTTDSFRIIDLMQYFMDISMAIKYSVDGRKVRNNIVSDWEPFGHTVFELPCRATPTNNTITNNDRQTSDEEEDLTTLMADLIEQHSCKDELLDPYLIERLASAIESAGVVQQYEYMLAADRARYNKSDNCARCEYIGECEYNTKEMEMKRAEHATLLGAMDTEVAQLKENAKSQLDLVFDDIKKVLTRIKNEKRISKGPKLPKTLPQQTFEEQRAIGQALVDSSTLRNWKLSPDGKKLIHQRPNKRHKVIFDPNSLPDIWMQSRPNTPDEMKAFVQNRGFYAWKLSQLVICCAILKQDVPILIDEFVEKLFKPQKNEDRNAKRVWVWETLCLLFSIQLDGVRAGKYQDRQTKNTMDLAFRNEPPISISPGSCTYAYGEEIDWPHQIPYKIGFTMGNWGEEARKDSRSLQYFGDLEDILDIPCGQISGAWAQSILAALIQKWREKAVNVNVSSYTYTDCNGDDHTVKLYHLPIKFTRRKLLVHEFPPDERFSILNLAYGHNPIRARRAWNNAITILKTSGHIHDCIELTHLDYAREGWQDDWLDQPLDILPNEETGKAAVEIKNAKRRIKILPKRKNSPESTERK